LAAVRRFEHSEEATSENQTERPKGIAEVYNLGTGRGYSVIEMVEAMRKASGKPIPIEFVDRRAGDIASCYADPTKAVTELKWTAKHTLEEMAEDAWRWQSNNPDGYAEGDQAPHGEKCMV
jgi:UDP-glucose 4-epimerase